MNLIISNQAISQHNGLFSLNDLHKVSGGVEKHKPSNFLRNQETKDLIAEIESENQIAYTIVQGGNTKTTKQGTFVCRELVYRYAMWISAKFSLMVVRAFDVLSTRAVPWMNKTTADERAPLRQAVSLLVSRCGLDYGTAYTLVHQYIGVSHIDEIALSDLPKAIGYVHSLIIKPSATLQDEFSILCHQATNKAMDYLWGLHDEIKRLGGKTPKFDMDEEMLARAILTRTLQGKRFMISLDYRNSPTLSLVDQQSFIVREDNIAKIIGDPGGVSANVLPDIIKAALKRTGVKI